MYSVTSSQSRRFSLKIGRGVGGDVNSNSLFLSKFAITVRTKRHSRFDISLLSRKPSNVVDTPRSVSDLVRECRPRMLREEETVLFGRCRGESPRARLLLMCHNVHGAKSSNYTTQGNYQTLTSTVCMTWHSKTPDPASALISMGCFQLRYMFRHRQVDQTTRIQQNCTGEKALATNTIHYLNQDWPTSTNSRATQFIKDSPEGRTCVHASISTKGGGLYSLQYRYLQTIN